MHILYIAIAARLQHRNKVVMMSTRSRVQERVDVAIDSHFVVIKSTVLARVQTLQVESGADL